MSPSNWRRLIRNASKSVVILTTEDGLKRKSQHIAKSLEKAQKKGVEIKTYITGEVINRDKTVNKVFNPIYTDKLKSRMCIVDGKEAMLMLYEDKTLNDDHDVAVWLKTPYVASALSDMINHTHK